MLESLCQGAGTIHELNLAGAFPERAPYRPRELYAALKATPLYDPERQQWNCRLTEGQTPDTHRHAQPQLLGALVEAQLSPKVARGIFERLKSSPLYDAERGQWNRCILQDQTLHGTDRGAGDQMLGVLVEAHFDPVRAAALYAQLQATALYHSGRRQWNGWMSKAQILQSTYHGADDQLLGVLVEAQFGLERARTRYESLKASALYDPVREQWNSCMSEQQTLKETDRHAADQLLGVLAEAEFNPENARRLYEQLKATPLYDAEHNQWCAGMTKAQYLYGTDRDAPAQLFAVLVEAKLLSTSPAALAETVPPLPVTEEW